MNRDYIQIEEKYGTRTYQRFPVTIVRGSGALLWDENGNEYIDCMGGYGVAIVGHCNRAVVEAIKRQAETLITCHGSLYNDKRAEFLEKLAGCAPRGLDASYLSSSGAEAVEVALKLARKYTGKKGLVSMKGGYHGKTFGALSATWNKKYKEAFEPVLQDVEHVEYGDIAALEGALKVDTAAVMLEPIQGEGGIIIPPKEFLRQVREVCDKHGVLMILDEIQTGLGRTGRMWASEHSGISPDIMTVAKGLAGGVPIGATVTKREILNSFKKGEQTSTFGGNPLACAAGSATLDYITQNDLPSMAERKGAIFTAGLTKIAQGHKIGREVRGMGVMLALELRIDIQNILLESLKEHVIFTYSGRNVVRLLPPIVIEDASIERSIGVLDKVVASEEGKLNG